MKRVKPLVKAGIGMVGLTGLERTITVSPPNFDLRSQRRFLQLH